MFQFVPQNTMIPNFPLQTEESANLFGYLSHRFPSQFTGLMPHSPAHSGSTDFPDSLNAEYLPAPMPQTEYYSLPVFDQDFAGLFEPSPNIPDYGLEMPSLSLTEAIPSQDIFKNDYPQHEVQSGILDVVEVSYGDLVWFPILNVTSHSTSQPS